MPITEEELQRIERGAKYGTTPGETQALVDEIRLLRDPQLGMAWVIFADGRARRYPIDPGAEWCVLHDREYGYELGVERTFRRVTAWVKGEHPPQEIVTWTSCYVEGEKGRP
jgi:hypothetical protein